MNCLAFIVVHSAPEDSLTRGRRKVRTSIQEGNEALRKIELIRILTMVAEASRILLKWHY